MFMVTVEFVSVVTAVNFSMVVMSSRGRLQSSRRCECRVRFIVCFSVSLWIFISLLPRRVSIASL